MSDWYVLNDAGEPVREPDLLKAARWFEAAERHVADDAVGDTRVSTVFLGLDHSFSRGGPPVLWESMIFGGPLDGTQLRYHTRAEALAGHASLVRSARRAAAGADEG